MDIGLSERIGLPVHYVEFIGIWGLWYVGESKPAWTEIWLSVGEIELHSH